MCSCRFTLCFYFYVWLLVTLHFHRRLEWRVSTECTAGWRAAAGAQAPRPAWAAGPSSVQTRPPEVQSSGRRGASPASKVTILLISANHWRCSGRQKWFKFAILLISANHWRYSGHQKWVKFAILLISANHWGYPGRHLSHGGLVFDKRRHSHHARRHGKRISVLIQHGRQHSRVHPRR